MLPSSAAPSRSTSQRPLRRCAWRKRRLRRFLLREQPHGRERPRGTSYAAQSTTASMKVWACRIASGRVAQTPTVTVLPFPTVHFHPRRKLISTTEKAMPRCSTEGPPSHWVCTLGPLRSPRFMIALDRTQNKSAGLRDHQNKLVRRELARGRRHHAQFRMEQPEQSAALLHCKKWAATVSDLFAHGRSRCRMLP